MKSKKIISEITKMKFLMSYEKGKVISEQSVVGAPAAGTATATTTPTSPAQTVEGQIIAQIVRATQGMGTNENQVYDAVSKITSAPQFWQIDAALKQVGNKLNFAEIINDEYGVGNFQDIQKIIDHLKKIGIDATAQKYGTNTMTKNSFKINSTPTTAQPAETPKETKPVKKTVFTSNENFPLKFQQQGEKIKQLQTALDVRNNTGQPNITGKFWTATEMKLKQRAAELGLTYDRNTGVTEEMFNAIVNVSGEPSEPVTTQVPNQQVATNKGFQQYAQSQFGTQL